MKITNDVEEYGEYSVEVVDEFGHSYLEFVFNDPDQGKPFTIKFSTQEWETLISSVLVVLTMTPTPKGTS